MTNQLLMPTLRRFMRDGILKGYVSKDEKVFRPSRSRNRLLNGYAHLRVGRLSP